MLHLEDFIYNFLSKVEAPIVDHTQHPTYRDEVFPIKVARDIQPKLRMCFFWIFFKIGTIKVMTHVP